MKIKEDRVLIFRACSIAWINIYDNNRTMELNPNILYRFRDR